MKRTRLVIDGRVVRRQPPVVGDYCWPPTSTNASKACVYEAASCTVGDRLSCSRCAFTFCPNHLKTHVRKMPALPPDTWRSLLKRLRQGLDALAKNPKRPMPYVEIAVRVDDHNP